MTTPDRFSFRVPKGAYPVRRHVVEALGLATWTPAIQLFEDPQRIDTIYVISTKAQRVEIMYQSTRLNGCERTGDMRDYVQGKRDTVPTCRRCGKAHWQYQTCT